MMEEPSSCSQPSAITFKDTPARQGVIDAALLLRRYLAPNKRKAYRDAWATIETYLAVSMRVLDETPFSQIRGAAVTEEIKAILDGRHRP